MFSGRGVGHHVDEQLLDLTGLLDAAVHLADRRRMVTGRGGPQCIGVPGDTVGQSGQPPADQRPVLIGVGGHQIEYVAHRLQRRGDHVQFTDVESSVMQLDLHAEPFPHGRDRHRVDVVLRTDRVQFPQRGPSRVGACYHTVF